MFNIVINVSNISSSYCYSLIRVEPYTSCSYGCVYCYARWYRENGKPKPYFKVLNQFKSLAKKIKLAGLKPIPARLSTLSDPFQPDEARFKLSLKILLLALKYQYPVVVNSKSVILIQEPWIKVLKQLAIEGLTLFQVSISTLSREAALKLEPNAPPPEERLKVALKLSSLNIPVVVRISPYIPGLSLKPSPEELVSILAKAGVRHVIVESIRTEAGMIEKLGLTNIPLESYSFRLEDYGYPVVKPALQAKLGEYLKLKSLLKDYGITFATCKEGLFSLHTAKDCCGFYLLNCDYAKRPTLYEYYLASLKTSIPVNSLPPLSENYIYGEKLNSYPRILRKPLKNHEKRLIKVASELNILSKLTPELTIKNGEIRLKPILNF
ncbi:radical SAM protein [Candidatus Bathyarchaeota archaeon]|nr:MAG: radical SAM protein [Candidatus Bathyarchaeota archaeon]